MLRSDAGNLPCETNDMEMWYSDDPILIARAKALCLGCARIELCLEECLGTELLMGQQLRGVHGGMTEAERNRLKP